MHKFYSVTCGELAENRSKKSARGFGNTRLRKGLSKISVFSKKSFGIAEKKYSRGIPVDVRTKYTVSLYALVEMGARTISEGNT